MYNLIFNYKETYNLFSLKNSKFSKKMLKIKNQVQVFPSHIKGFCKKIKLHIRYAKTSYTLCITRTLIFFNFLPKMLIISKKSWVWIASSPYLKKRNILKNGFFLNSYIESLQQRRVHLQENTMRHFLLVKIDIPF